MPKFGVSIYSISRKILSGEMTPEQGIIWLGEQGAEVVEIVPFGIDMVGQPELIDTCLKAAQQAGTVIDNYSLNANFLLLNDEELQQERARVKQHIDVAHRLGVSTMRIDSASFRRPPEQNTITYFLDELDFIVDNYKYLCDYASQYNIKLLLENHGFHVNGSERVGAIMSKMDPSVFGHQLDVGNYICVDDNPEIATKKMMPYATTVHMKDFYIRRADRDPGDATQFSCSGAWFKSVNGTFLRGSILGQGDLDMYNIIKTVKDSGFDGNIFVEYEGMEECEYGTKVSLDNLKRIWSLV